ncbi:MAG: polyhydroxyalkanoate synthesis regulator DNA-binding domain-containing protein [Myxococcota bacterium]
MLIKKYGNRRLYDTESSRYITLEDLTEAIRGGAEARVVDAKTGADLTQQTLTQIIIEGRGADRIFPAALLHQLIRLGDDALADFLGRYVQAALELYLQARKATQSFMPFNPLVALTQFANNTPFGGWNNPAGVQPIPVPSTAPAPTPPPPAPAPAPSDVDQLRKELEELKGMLRKRKK